jgi:1,4-dihydroxy-2-naphthoate octaprenyltransferase
VAAAFVLLPLLALRRPWALVALVALPLAARPLQRIAQGATGMALIPVLIDTARLQLVFGALLALGLALSG